MPKYRLLTTEELTEFEKEFIDYLIVNGIDADSWEKLKVEKPEEASKIVELFSDVVFEKILRKAKYLVFINRAYHYSFHYGEEKAELIILKFQDSEYSSDPSNLNAIMEFLSRNQTSIDFQMQTKAYKKTRELELFEMIESGCIIEDGGIFQFCAKLNKNSNSE